MLKQVMVRAWAIAKAGVEKFGGKVREYFAAALSIAWKEIKNVQKVELVGSEKQVKWATDIIERIEAVQPKMKEVYTQVVLQRKRKENETYLAEGLAFIDSLTNFPLCKNKASNYINCFGYIKTEEDALEILFKIFYYTDVAASVSKHVQSLLKSTYRKLTTM